MPIKNKSKKVKVNLGCGSHLPAGFINIDDYYLPENKTFIKGDARNIPLASDSVDYIICDQVLEHIPMADVQRVLQEIRRVLKVGGECVIIVPDFEDAVRQWLSVDHNGAFEPMRYHYLSEVVYGNQLHEGEFHKTPMCAGYLHYAMNVAGLTKHEIVFYPAFGAVPKYDGVRPYRPEAVCRNAQLVAKITKTK